MFELLRSGSEGDVSLKIGRIFCPLKRTEHRISFRLLRNRNLFVLFKTREDFVRTTVILCLYFLLMSSQC